MPYDGEARTKFQKYIRLKRDGEFITYSNMSRFIYIYIYG